jgi:O-antigen/teichoic acid export membrane protein
MPSASKNIFWLSLSRLIAAILVFLAYRQLQRYLGPDAFGQYQAVLSYVTLFGVIIDFGLQQFIIKKISEEPQQAKKYFHNFLATEIFLSIAVYALLIAVALTMGHFSPEKYPTVVLQAIAVAGLGAVLAGLSYPFLSVMSAFFDLKRVALINFLSSLINVSIIFAAIIFHKYIVFLTINQVIFGIVSLSIYYWFIKRHVPKPEIWKALRSFDRPLVKKIFIAAFPFALLVGFSTIYNRIDMLLITWLLDYHQAGSYASAYRFFDFIAFFPAVVSHSLYPLFTTLMVKGNIGAVKENLEKYLRFLIALALPLGVGGSLLAKQLILFFADERYLSGASALAILVWAPAILFIYIVANSLVISQLTKSAVMITGANVVLNIIGNIVLLPIIGIRGAAIMTVTCELLQGLFYFYFIHKKITRFRILPQFAKPAIASVVMGLAVYLVGTDKLLLPLLAGAVVYPLALLALRFFSKEDWVFAKNFIRPQAAVLPHESQ